MSIHRIDQEDVMYTYIPYCSAVTRSKTELFVETWMDLERLH